QHVAPDHFRRVRRLVVGVEVDLDLDRVLDDVVVGEDEAVLAVDDEARARRARDLIALAPAPVRRLLIVVALALALSLPAAGAAEEAAEEVVRAAATAAEEPLEVLR